MIEKSVYYDYGDDEFEYEYDLEEFLDTLGAYEVADALYELASDELIDSMEMPHDHDGFCKEALDDEYLMHDLVLELSTELADYFEDEIKEHYEDDAYEALKDAEEYARDPYAYYGVSRSDFV